MVLQDSSGYTVKSSKKLRKISKISVYHCDLQCFLGILRLMANHRKKLTRKGSQMPVARNDL